MKPNPTSDVDGELITPKFLRHMLHELKAPARHVRFFGASLREAFKTELSGAESQNTKLSSEVAESLDVIERAGAILDSTLDGIRELMIATETSADAGVASLQHVADEAWSKTLRKHVGSNATMNCTGALDIDVPQSAWTRMLECLFDNCLHNRNDGISLQVDVSATPDAVLIADNGIGMTAAEFDIAIQPFERLRTTSPQRPGLGLTIACEIARRCGSGVRHIESPGTGTCIAIERSHRE